MSPPTITTLKPVAPQDDLIKIEQQIFDLETAYLGYGLKDAKSLAAARAGTFKRSDIAPINPEDRVFSLSSVTSRAGELVHTKMSSLSFESGGAATMDPSK